MRKPQLYHSSSIYSLISRPELYKKSNAIEQSISPKIPFSFYYRFGKPVFDILLSIIILIAFAVPFLMIAIAIKITSKGPVFFRQKRIGLHNKPFTIYKFRSMYADSPIYSEKPNSQDDPRITPVGRFLRKTSLDELPQIINVIKGDMSLIGPRPEMPFLVEEYNAQENMRHLVKPGITGLWQLSPQRVEPIRNGIHWDLKYIENISFKNDIIILFRTFKVFFDHNTY